MVKVISVQPPPSWQDLRTRGEIVVILYHKGGGGVQPPQSLGGGNPQARGELCTLGATRGWQMQGVTRRQDAVEPKWGRLVRVIVPLK